jgi:hypothetical protein
MRTLSTSFSLLLAGLVLASCGGSKDNTVSDKALVDTNFDNLVGWVDNTNGTLTKKFAHSGHYSLTVGGGPEYAVTYRTLLGQVITTKPRKLQVSAWVRTEEANTPAQLVVQINKPGVEAYVFWKGIPLSTDTKPGEWKEVKTELVMPAEVASDQSLSVYLWGNGAGKPVYLDDLQITNAE